MKASILYFSRTGNTKRMAEAIAEGMRSEGGVETGIFPLDGIDVDFVNESRCVILGTPTYLATMAAQVKVWLDTPNQGLVVAGKLGGAFATQDYLHGGGDIAVQSVLAHLMVRGMLVYSGGGAHGKPVIHLGPVALKDDLAGAEETFRTYGKRMAGKMLELFG